MEITSILDSTKKLLGIELDDPSFDDDLIIAVNGALFAATQIGVGPSEGFIITSNAEEWKTFIGDRKDLEGVKTYIYLKTRLLFDPPQNSFLTDAIKEQIKELEWRLNIQV